MRGIPREAVDENAPVKGSAYHAADVADKVNVCRWEGMEDTYGVDMSKRGARGLRSLSPSCMRPGAQTTSRPMTSAPRRARRKFSPCMKV